MEPKSPHLCLSCQWNPAKTGGICDFCTKQSSKRRNWRENHEKGAEMAELENEIDGKTAEMPPSDLENYLNKTEKEVENGPNSPSHGGSEAKNHRNFTARLVISPTFDTKTGERNKDIEALEYTCGDCDWKATVHDAGAAGLQLILHTLGIDDLKVEWLDAKNFAESADFDIDNPEEVLEKMRSMAKKAENDA